MKIDLSYLKLQKDPIQFMKDILKIYRENPETIYFIPCQLASFLNHYEFPEHNNEN